MEKKVAIILFNLGGPNKRTNVKNFLFNLFYDKAIINLPNPFRWLIAKFISSSRAKNSQANYNLIGGYSPILENTNKQAEALEKQLLEIGYNAKVFTCMRYSYPRASEIIYGVKDFAPTEIILLPLYPQFSSTTSSSSIYEFKKFAAEELSGIPIKTVCCFFKEDKFIQSQVNLVSKAIEEVENQRHIILFSAHGLPKKIIDAGDPYQWQVEQTVDLIIKKLPMKPMKHIISYQSRVGPVEWIKPYTEDEIIKAAKENLAIIIVPIAFVSEHLETLVELDIEYEEIAKENGAKSYIRVSTPSLDTNFITSLAELTQRFIEKNTGNALSCELNKLCSKAYTKCISEG
ncbi:MAG: hemH [Rickettsiaceae bacterium]|jgi:ferrochelatase|nr:hemH [Rickettsiaceae bacterium]